MSKKKKSLSTTSNKSNHTVAKRTQNGQESDEEDASSDEEDESEPMDFDRAFGNDALKIEHMDIYQKDGLINGLNTSEGDCYFDLSANIDLKTYTQPVLLSSTINLNSLAAVRILLLLDIEA